MGNKSTVASDRGKANKAARAEAIEVIESLQGKKKLTPVEQESLLLALLKWLGLSE